MAKILDKPLDNVSVQGNGVVTKNELRAILKNISVQVPDAQSNSNLEVFEVLELKTDAETKQQEDAVQVNTADESNATVEEPKNETSSEEVVEEVRAAEEEPVIQEITEEIEKINREDKRNLEYIILKFHIHSRTSI